MTRGEYVTDSARHVLASYDDRFWGDESTHREVWKEIATRPWIAGDFVWTGFDYDGEPKPFYWPSVSSFFGCMDLCGLCAICERHLFSSRDRRHTDAA